MFAPWIMTLHLVTYHLWLLKEGITTFDHIMYKREIARLERDVKVSSYYSLFNLYSVRKGS
jgi:hypothetical protein